VRIDKQLNREIMIELLSGIFAAGHNLQLYGEYQKIQVGEKSVTNTGRSKDGALNDFHPFIFSLLMESVEQSGMNVSLVPFLVSYEHVKEDIMMDGVQKIKARLGGTTAYAAELLYNVFSFTKFGREKPRAVLSFGEKIPFSQEAYQAYRESRGLVSHISKESLQETGGVVRDWAAGYMNKFLNRPSPKKATIPSWIKLGTHYAKTVKSAVGDLQIPFPSQVVSAATMRALEKMIEETGAPPKNATVSMKRVEKYYKFIVPDLRQQGCDMSYLEQGGVTMTLEEMVERASKVLRDSFGGPLFTYDSDYIYVRNPAAFFQYGRHISHMLGTYALPRWTIFWPFKK
jgi:hypothetical protein